MTNSSDYPPYSMTVEWDPNDDIFVVTIPELPGCITHGATYQEAVTQGQEAMEGWVDIARADGETLPAPRAYGTSPAVAV
jgi:predicted RNase H-like HicB family nuclease